MEICTVARGLSLPLLPLSSHSHLRSVSSFSLNKSPNFSGVVGGRKVSVLRVTSEDEGSKFTEDRKDGVATLGNVPSVVDDDITLGKVSTTVSQSVYNDSRQTESSAGEESSSDESGQSFDEFLDNLGLKLESEDSYTIFLYGGGALVAVWLLSAIIGAIDTIPVVPKLLEVVGLGYSLWFTSRYLLFKKNREELGAKIDELKRDVLGDN